jgi:hypothetical protein
MNSCLHSRLISKYLFLFKKTCIGNVLHNSHPDINFSGDTECKYLSYFQQFYLLSFCQILVLRPNIYGPFKAGKYDTKSIS